MLTALVIAYLAGVFTVLICAALVLVPVPHEEEHAQDSLRNVVSLTAHPLPSVRQRTSIRSNALRNRKSRMVEMH